MAIMPFYDLPGFRYGMISYDADGQERRDDPMSERLLEAARGASAVHLFAHGWMGDARDAEQQYNAWIGALHAQQPDAKALYIGLHWPSKPHGDEDLPDDRVRAFGGSQAAREALATISAADSLTPKAISAFETLDKGLGLPEKDHDDVVIKPSAFQDAEDDDDDEGGGGFFSGLRVKMLRLLSYKQMKFRARTIGEGGMHNFVSQLQGAFDGPIHLMGHSFGCVVVSSICNGTSLKRQIDSVALVQGAVSLWCYSPDITLHNAGPGYFHRIITEKRVRGPIITTRSKHDTAVRTMYPNALSGNSVAFVEDQDFPRIGAVGMYGLQGVPGAVNTAMLSKVAPYEFEAGRVYNLEASAFICKKSGLFEGAHSDIAGPEVANAIRQASLA